MGSKREVVVQGGGLYTVGEYESVFYVRKVSVGMFTSSGRDIGTARSLDGGLALIRSHSGKSIKHIG